MGSLKSDICVVMQIKLYEILIGITLILTKMRKKTFLGVITMCRLDYNGFPSSIVLL